MSIETPAVRPSEPAPTAEPDEAAPDAVARATAARAPQRSVRLPVDLLDRMMSGMSEMVLARNELARRLRDEQVDPLVEAALERLSLTVAEMRDTVTRTRMQKIDALFSALPRMVRDTAGELGKHAAAADLMQCQEPGRAVLVDPRDLHGLAGIIEHDQVAEACDRERRLRVRTGPEP